MTFARRRCYGAVSVFGYWYANKINDYNNNNKYPRLFISMNIIRLSGTHNTHSLQICFS